jgi:hypothetical protein
MFAVSDVTCRYLSCQAHLLPLRIPSEGRPGVDSNWDLALNSVDDRL